MLKNYIINVATNTERQAHIRAEFGKYAIPFTFFSAITPTKNMAYKKQFGINKIATTCTDVEMACFLSHVSLWQKCVDENLDYIGIFEDDICLGNNADQFLISDDWLTAHVDMLKLEKSGARVKLGKTSIPILASNRVINELLSRNVGAAGYLLSKHGASYLLDFIQQQTNLDAIDIVLFDNAKYPKNLPIYLLRPSLVVQQSALFHDGVVPTLLKSQLGDDRGKELKIKATPWQRIKKELQRHFKGRDWQATQFE